MDVSAKLSSKGQLTVPKAVREALGLNRGDAVVFRVEGQHALLARTVDFLELAGTFEVPVGKVGAPWATVIRRTRAGRAKRRR